MDWVDKFYSESGKWWSAENKITERDLSRVSLIKEFKKSPQNVLELGSSYGNTAAATAQAGFYVIGVEISDRFNESQKWVDQKYSGSLRFIKDDFYKINLNEKFGVVAYWNGFGIGTDDDQKTLLKRVAQEWLLDDGIVLMDIQNPYVWKRWAKEGGEELKADPARGFHFNISEDIKFDDPNNIVTDTWWVTEHPEEKISQVLRCYTPNDFLQLIEGSGLKLDAIFIDGKEQSIDEANSILKDETKEYHEYLVKLSKS